MKRKIEPHRIKMSVTLSSIWVGMSHQVAIDTDEFVLYYEGIGRIPVPSELIDDLVYMRLPKSLPIIAGINCFDPVMLTEFFRLVIIYNQYVPYKDVKPTALCLKSKLS